MNKIILDLCGGTGSWSKPYREAGYDVRLITLPENDVRDFEPPENVYGILSAPPCTMFSHARTTAKDPRDLKSGMEIVQACLDIIWKFQFQIEKDSQQKPPLKFWAMENPNGLLKWFLGKPAFNFSPWEFGDPYKKDTCLWGYFNPPKKHFSRIFDVMDEDQYRRSMTNSQKLPDHPGNLKCNERRSITPEGFARAFFTVNR